MVNLQATRCRTGDSSREQENIGRQSCDKDESASRTCRLIVSVAASTALTVGEGCCCKRVGLTSVELTFSEVVRQ